MRAYPARQLTLHHTTANPIEAVRLGHFPTEEWRNAIQLALAKDLLGVRTRQPDHLEFRA